MVDRIGAALLASLGLNLFLGGFVAQDLLSPEPPPQGFDRPGPHDALPPRAREAFRAELGDMRENRRRVRAAREELRVIASAQTLDEAALEEGFARLRERRLAQMEAFDRARLEAMKSLEPEERASLLDRRRVRGRSQKP